MSRDGLADTLELTPTVTAKQAGTYTLVAHLQDSSGAAVVLGGGAVSLQPGTQQIAIDFDGASIYKSGLSGPYHLVNVTLADTTTSPASIEAKAADLGATKGYWFDEFQH